MTHMIRFVAWPKRMITPPPPVNMTCERCVLCAFEIFCSQNLRMNQMRYVLIATLQKLLLAALQFSLMTNLKLL